MSDLMGLCHHLASTLDDGNVQVLMIVALSSNEGSVESVHMRRLTKAFSAGIHKIWMQMKARTVKPVQNG